MDNKLLDWFEKTGYPLELYSESILASNGYLTTSSYIYHDNENNIHRELDLHAQKCVSSKDHKTILIINFLIECKKSEKPFVILSNKNKNTPKISIGEYYGIDDPAARIAINNPNRYINLLGNSGSGFRLIQGFTSGDDIFHKVTNTLIKSFNDFLSNEEELLESYIEENTNTITFPLLLIDAPFHELSLNSDNGFIMTDIQSGIVYCTSHLSRHYPEPFPIPIIEKQSLNEFLSNVEEFIQSTLNFLIANPNNNIKNFNKLELGLISKTPNT